MSVTKISDYKNLNLWQQVEMCLRHVYFRHTLPYHVVNCTCILSHLKLILFLRIVVWHMRVSTHLLEVTVQDGATLSKTLQKRISTSSFEKFYVVSVTANRRI